MQVKINFAAPKPPKTGAVAVGVMDGRKLSPSAEILDKAAGGAGTIPPPSKNDGALP